VTRSHSVEDGRPDRQKTGHNMYHIRISYSLSCVNPLSLQFERLITANTI